MHDIFFCFLFFLHKRDDWREWKKDHSYQNDLKMISFILTEVINVSHSPLRHEFLANFRIKCQKRCYIRNFVWISLRYSRHSMLMNSFLIKIETLQRMVTYELQIGRKEQSSWLLFCYIFLIVEYMKWALFIFKLFLLVCVVKSSSYSFMFLWLCGYVWHLYRVPTNYSLSYRYLEKLTTKTRLAKSGLLPVRILTS